MEKGGKNRTKITHNIIDKKVDDCSLRNIPIGSLQAALYKLIQYIRLTSAQVKSYFTFKVHIHFPFCLCEDTHGRSEKRREKLLKFDKIDKFFFFFFPIFESFSE